MQQRWQVFSERQTAIEVEQQRLQALRVHPNSLQAVAVSAMLEKPLIRDQCAADLLRRPEVDYAALTAIAGLGPAVADAGVAEQIEIQAKYSGYLERQQAEIQRQHRHQDQPLAVNFDYNTVRGLSNEAREKLQNVRPETIGQAARIPGITPAAVSLLLIHMKKHKMARQRA